MKYPIIIFAIFTFLSSCRTKSPWEKVTVDINEVDSITVARREKGVTDINHKLKYVRMTNKQAEFIVDNWNMAASVGPWKYLPTFEMIIYFEDETARHFRINAEHIKEDSDETYDLGGKAFFEQLLTKD